MNEIPRRTFLKTAGTAAAALALPAAAARAATAAPGQNPLPRWRGFNLQFLYRTNQAPQAPNEDYFRWIAGWGFDFVRLPLNYRMWLKKKTRSNVLPKSCRKAAATRGTIPPATAGSSDRPSPRDRRSVRSPPQEAFQ